MSSVAYQQKVTIYEVVDDIRKTSQVERKKGCRRTMVFWIFDKWLKRLFIYVACWKWMSRQFHPENLKW